MQGSSSANSASSVANPLFLTRAHSLPSSWIDSQGVPGVSAKLSGLIELGSKQSQLLAANPDEHVASIGCSIRGRTRPDA